MTVAAFLLIVGAVALMVVVHRALVGAAVARLEAGYKAALERDHALDKQTKALLRRQARVTADAAKTIGAAKSIHKQIQTVLCDPRIQRALDEGVSARGE